MSAPELATAPVLAAALMAPHRLPLRRARPQVAIAVWILALALRAVTALALAALVLVELSDVGAVRAALDWCWHELLPDVPGALGFAETPVTHAALAAPALALSFSLVWLATRLVRSWLVVRRQLARAVGEGPHGSTIVPDEGVLVALTGWGRGRLLVSEAAVEQLDERELEAGLVHELAHLRRRHRPLLLLGTLCAAIALPLPGTRAARRELHFHVERDADRYTVDVLRDPLALASAICKAAGALPPQATLRLGGRGRVSLRLEELLDGPQRPSRRVELGAGALAGVLLCLLVALAALAPARASGLPGDGVPTVPGHGCQHL